jgi:signal transduction histidine kinase
LIGNGGRHRGLGTRNGALDRLSALVDGMGQVSANIAHDLKTPLNRLQMEAAADKAAPARFPAICGSPR